MCLCHPPYFTARTQLPRTTHGTAASANCRILLPGKEVVNGEVACNPKVNGGAALFLTGFKRRAAVKTQLHYSGTALALVFNVAAIIHAGRERGLIHLIGLFTGAMQIFEAVTFGCQTFFDGGAVVHGFGFALIYHKLPSQGSLPLILIFALVYEREPVFQWSRRRSAGDSYSCQHSTCNAAFPKPHLRHSSKCPTMILSNSA